MIGITTEEEKIIEKYRELKDWGVLEVIKQNGKLYEFRVRNDERFIADT